MNSNILIDSHAHLDFDSFDVDRAQVIQSAFDAGVQCILNICLGPEKEKFEKSLAITDLHPNIYAAVGVHPHDADRMTDAVMELLQSYTQNPKVVCIGEIGLDYYYDHSDRARQVEVFGNLIDLAVKNGLPISVHTRNAFEDTHRLLKEKNVFEKVGGIIHCFTGTADEAKAFLDLGAYISFSGVVTFKKAVAVAEAAKVVPLDRLLIETDSPYLAPEPHRGKRNEPMFVQYVAQALAGIHGTTVNEIGTACADNLTKLLFKN